MLIDAEAWAALERLDAGEPAAAEARVLASLAANGLIESGEEKPRLTADGVNALAFRALRGTPCPRWAEKRASPEYRELSITLWELELLRCYTRLPLRKAGVDLTAAVAEAHYDPPAKRWLVQLSDAEATEVGRALWLDALSGPVGPWNRVARIHGVRYPTMPT